MCSLMQRPNKFKYYQTMLLNYISPSSFEIWSAESYEWNEYTLHESRINEHCSFIELRGRMHLVGGISDKIINSHFKLSLDPPEIIKKQELNYNRNDPLLCMIDLNHFVAIGGLSQIKREVGYMEVYNCKEDKWVILPQLTDNVIYKKKAVYMNGYLYVIGMNKEKLEYIDSTPNYLIMEKLNMELSVKWEHYMIEVNSYAFDSILIPYSDDTILLLSSNSEISTKLNTETRAVCMFEMKLTTKYLGGQYLYCFPFVYIVNSIITINLMELEN